MVAMVTCMTLTPVVVMVTHMTLTPLVAMVTGMQVAPGRRAVWEGLEERGRHWVHVGLRGQDSQ